MDDMILHGVRYYLPSSVTGERRTELIRMLIRHDAIPVNFTYDATHIITTPGQSFEEVQEVNPEISIVSDLWVERSIAAGKMQQSLRTSDEEVLSAGITLLGGQWRTELTRDVTHLFAESSSSERYRTGMDHRLKVLVPHWFDDAMRLGIRDLSTDSYEWPDVAEPPARNPSQLSPSKLVSKDVWSGRRILLSTNLELTGSRKQLVEDWIRQYAVKYDGDGEGTDEEELVLAEECDVFVTRYRSGPAFFKTFGTLVWLLDVQLGGVFSSPQDRVLHFPTLPGVVEDFTKHEISITAYTGEAREYLKKLIVLMGGTFTPYLSPRNTILIAARQSGTKIVKAMEWSVPIVNHTWLEDCFLHWKSLEPAHLRYTSYPVGVDFQNSLGERSMSNDIKEIISKNIDLGDTINPRIDTSDTTLIGQWVAPIKQPDNILDLPPELLAIIASSLPREFLASFCLVSRHFYSILSVLLYSDVLSPPLTASQSSRLIETLRNEQVLTWTAHPATLIRKLGLTGNAYGASEVQTQAAVGVLRKLTSLARGSAVRALHWDMAAGLDELGRILGAPGQFPNLTELIVKSYATNTNFNVSIDAQCSMNRR
ncbi:hypothetical protein B0H11DRAFT_1987692 [Mycena galericulata]|nr:hypothetical protein B0H11DRAFT_1987692 [Mycena galericulata]